MGLSYDANSGRYLDSFGSQVSPAFGRGNGGNGVSQQTQAQIEALAQELAQQMLQEQAAAAQMARNGRIFTSFDTVGDIVPNNLETVTKGLFCGNTGSLTTMFTSSNLTATQKSYYQQIFSDGDPAF